MSSTPLVAWRTFMPPFLAEPWRRYQTLASTDPRRLQCALQINQRLSRYLTGLYISFGVSNERPKEYRNLVKRVDRLTLGMWWNTAAALAIPSSKRSGPVGESARALLDDDVQSALDTIIEMRNEAAHPPDDRLGFDSIRSRLPEVDAALHTVVRAFACLAQLRLIHIRGTKLTRDDKHVHDALVFGATDALQQTITAARPLPSDCIYAVIPTGEMVMMDPWVHIIDDTGGIVPGLLSPQSDSTFTWNGARLATRSEEGDVRKALHKKPRRFMLEADLTTQLCSAGAGAETPVVPGWRLVQRLGGGSNAGVWVGHRETGSKEALCVLKIVHNAAQSDQTSVLRFQREINIGRAVNHPNLVRCLDVTETTTGRSVMVQEYVEGESLAVRLRKKPALTPSQIATLGCDIGNALLALHERGVIHRDVKPANILIEASGSARLIDLGVAYQDGLHPITTANQGIGTESFSAPEQRKGAPAEPAADVYSLGRVLAEAIKARYTRQALQSAPTELRDVARSMLAKVPSERMPLDKAVAALEHPSILNDGEPVAVGDVLPGDWTVCAAPSRSATGRGAWKVPVRDPSGRQTAAWVGMGTHGPKVVRNFASAKGMGCSVHEGLTFAVKMPSGTVKKPELDTATAVAAGVGAGAVAVGLAGAVVLGVGAIGAATGFAMKSSNGGDSDTRVPPGPGTAQRASQAPSPKGSSPMAAAFGLFAKVLTAKAPKKK